MSERDRRGSTDPEHPDEEAALAERSEGANSEQITDEANLRADPTPPGVDPEDDPGEQQDA